MEHDLIIWLLGIIQAVFGVIGVWLIKTVLRLSGEMVEVKTLLKMFSKTAAKVLHSPHTAELDELLEKYLDRHYELTNAEWTRLKAMCGEIEDNPEEPKEGRALAGWMKAVSEHKLFEPAGKARKHE